MNRTAVFTTRTLLTCAAFVGGASGAQAQQILSVVQSENIFNGTLVNNKTGTAGQTVSTNFGGADTRALTDYGVNKIAATGNAQYDQYAVSSWVDSYTVGGAAGSMVAVSFNFTIDGLASYAANSYANFNFNVYALRGSNWTISGFNNNHPQWYSPVGQGSFYEEPILTQVQPSRVVEADLRYFSGFSNYQNANGVAGTFQVKNSYDPVTDSYFQQSAASGQLGGTRFYADGFQIVDQNGVAGPIIPYSANASAASTRAAFVANFALLDRDQLCAGPTCTAGDYPGSNLSLTFNLAAGSVFSLATLLFVDDLGAGTVDFFHTAKLSSVTLSPGATIASQSGALTMNSDGSYGYPAAAAAVPEPATWGMMVLGFGLAGAALRTRRDRRSLGVA